MTKFVVDNGKNLIQAYDAAETDALLNQKANAADVYDQEEIDGKISTINQNIADVDAKFANYYPSTAVDDFLNLKADKVGEFDDLTAGHAKQLTSRVGETDKTPYNFRTSGGSLDIGDLETDKIIGGSVAWNQKYDVSIGTNGFRAAGSTLTAIGAKTKVICSGSDVSYFGVCPADADLYQFRTINGHKYYLCAKLSDININDKNYKIIFGNGLSSNIANDGTTICGIGQGNGSILYINAVFGTFTTNDDFTIDNLQIVDLTQMFDSTIADYIYSLETATAGAGVAWFKKLFPKSYYSYNAGQIMSVKTSKHITVGFNAFNEDFEIGGISPATGEPMTDTSTIRSKTFSDCIPNALYCLFYNGNVNTTSMRVYLYDANYNYLDFWGFISRPRTIEFKDARYFKVALNSAYGTEYKNDICINISWDGERNGEYEPYVANEYILASDLELRGIFKLDANNKLYADGDEYPDSGEVTRIYNIFEFSGSETWTYYEGSSPFFYCLTGKEDGEDRAEIFASNGIIGVLNTNGQLRVYLDDNPSITSETNMQTIFKAGSAFVYKKATPTSESVNGYTNPQKVDDFGTEQYVDGREVEIPVGHETFYVANLKAKLEMSPDSPDADGLYLMQHNNGENVYTPYISPIPALPSTDGTFVLKCTVSGTTKTLTWVEET